MNGSIGGLLSLALHHWRPAPTLLAVFALYLALYAWGVRRLGGRWPGRRTACFTAGVATLAVALQSGIDAEDDRLLTVHMVQHMLLLLVAPALLLSGRPLLLALRAMPSSSRRTLAPALGSRGARGLTHPLLALGVMWAVILLSHLSGFYEATLRHPLLHDIEHLAFLISGLLFWWPLLGGRPSPQRPLGGVARMAYVIAAMPPMAAVGAVLNRHATLVYPSYGAASRALGVNPLINQAQAGAMMWVGGGTLLALAGLTLVWQALVDEERRERAREQRAAQIAAAGQVIR
jgi:cytochrome c oxidase assembly factor CtaG